MLDFLGVTENWSAIENIPWTQRWTFSDDTTGTPVPLDGVTFTGRVYIGEQRDPVELDIQKSAAADEAHILIVSCVALPEGRHPYEIFSVSETGNQNRLISGYIGVIKTIDTLVDETKTYASRTLSIRLPGHVTRQIRLEWLSCTLAATSAQQAWEYYEKTKELSDGMADIAQTAADAAEKLSGLDNTLDQLAADVKAAQDAAADAEKWATDASKRGDDGLTPYVGANGNWWTGEGHQAHDTGIRAVPIDGKDGLDGKNGQNGKTPIIQHYTGDLNGLHYDGNYWYVWGTNPDTSAEEYLFTAILAEGKNGQPGQDGQNGDAIKRIIIPTVADLPPEGSTGTLYYIPQGSTPETWTIYAWLQKPDQTYAWEPVNETDHDYTQYAQTDLGNITVAADNYETQYPDTYYPKLSYLKRAIASAVQNTITQLVRLATTRLLGMVKLGTDNTIDTANSAPVGTNTDGQLHVGMAKTNQYGTVKTSWAEPLPDEYYPGPIGINTSGQLVAHEATITVPGVIKINNTKKITEGAYLQTTKDNLAIIPLAGYVSYGAVCFGTGYDITINNDPYIVTIPKCNGDSTYNQHAGNIKNAIIFNLSQQGCLRYDKTGPNGENDGNSLHLKHDHSLTITNQTLGVTRYDDLIYHDSYATGQRGGTIKVGSNLEISTQGILTVKTGNINADLPVTGTTVQQHINKLGYITQSELEAKNYVTKTRHDNDIATRVECAGGVKKLALMTEEQYASLGTKEATTLYLLY